MARIKKGTQLVSLLLGFLLFGISHLSAQSISGTINAYTAVTGVAANVFTVASAAAFSPGDRVLLIQMKDADVDQSNTTSAGSITCYNHSGKFEFATISAIAGNNITLSVLPCRTYNPANTLQMVRVPVYANPTVTGQLNATPFNGTTGGIIALETAGTLTLSANINADFDGYRGGRESCNGFVCNQNLYYYTFASCLAAEKGEGISEYIANNRAGRGAQANGGGGGSSVNAGGAGGGNIGAGGRGGDEWQGCGSNVIGGDAAYVVNPNFANCERAFMGGGGGGGQGNVGEGTDGANGGGLVIIMAGTIAGNGRTISAIGGTAGNAVHGGAGGGGAGGSVLLYCNNYTSALTVNVRGGNGGNNTGTASNPVGPGGGGGGGLLWVTGGTVSPSITLIANGGNPGTMNSGGSHQAGPGVAGASLTGLLSPCTSVCGPACPILPASFLNVSAELTPTGFVDVAWTTGTEENTSYFDVLRADKDGQFEAIGRTAAAGNAASARDYLLTDPRPYPGLNQYRIRLTDLNGQQQESEIVTVVVGSVDEGLVDYYPHPVQRGTALSMEYEAASAGSVEISVTDLSGKTVLVQERIVAAGLNTFRLPTSDLAYGMYLMHLEKGNSSEVVRLVVK